MCKYISALGLSMNSEQTADSVIIIPMDMSRKLCLDLEEKDIKEL
jgi:hypothetical protein